MKPKYEFLNKFLKGRSLYITVLIFSLTTLYMIYSFYGGQIINERLRQTIVVGWIVWLMWVADLVALFALLSLILQIIFSDLSRRVKLGALILHFGFALTVVQLVLIYLIGSSESWVSGTILMMCYVNLFSFAVGTALVKVGARGV